MTQRSMTKAQGSSAAAREWREAAARMLVRIEDTARSCKGRFPHWADPITGRWTSTADGDWTGGAWVGQLWLAHHATGDDRYREWAEKWSVALAPRLALETAFKGFGFYYGGSLGSLLAGSETGRRLALEAARTLVEMYDPVLGLIPLGGDAEEAAAVGLSESSVDSLQASPLLFWAARETGDANLYDLAVRHTDRVIALHLREDGSIGQSTTLEPRTGEVVRRHTHKGYSDSSTWGRAQAWGMLYSALGVIHAPQQASWLTAAIRTADWWIKHVPADQVAYWDFDDPGIPDVERDTAATAIAAAALLKLARCHVGDQRRGRYQEWAEGTVRSLIRRHLTPLGPTDGRVAGRLLDGCFTKRPAARAQDTVTNAELIFGSYYLFECLQVLLGSLEATSL